MRVKEVQVVVEEDGHLEIEHLPVKTGDRIRVILLMPDESTPRQTLYPLRGKGPYRFDEPTAPVMPQDWDPS